MIGIYLVKAMISGLNAEISIKKCRILKEFRNINNCLSFIICKMLAFVPEDIMFRFRIRQHSNPFYKGTTSNQIKQNDRRLTCEYQEFWNDMLFHKRGQSQLQLYTRLSFDWNQFSWNFFGSLLKDLQWTFHWFKLPTFHWSNSTKIRQTFDNLFYNSEPFAIDINDVTS